MMKLYSRVKRWGSLPSPGGIHDQDPFEMRCLDIIQEEADEMHRIEMANIKHRNK